MNNRNVVLTPIDGPTLLTKLGVFGVGPVGEEGVANIVNAFIEAGSQSIVSTLWELEDRATTHLMTVFYDHLAIMGLMLYVLRYAEELRDPKSALSGVKDTTVDASELSLTKQLINGSTSSFDLSAYKNDCEVAVKKLVDAKRKGKPLPEAESEPPRAKVINIMDALRTRLAESKKPKKPKKAMNKKTARRKKAA
jgi:non-homologous end joining protein Ku